MVKKKNKRAKELERSMPSVTEGFRRVLSEHGLSEYDISNIKLVSVSSAKALNANAENADSGHWEWRCEETGHGVECGWVWVND